ncbi:MAG: division/cell wall cluster transcriptional repressor MraZ [Ruminococcaceae bacterium]|nr:division/cell wall cluster transcriptional repressor MraZ [Oscillospiraceae bacterium]
MIPKKYTEGGTKMLVGSYKNTIDTKGRVFLPAKFRSYLGERIIIVKGAEGCLVVYTEEKYTEYIERLRKNGETAAKKYLRYLNLTAASIEPDAQGRILLTNELREHAGLTKDVLFVGMYDTVEIWNEEKAEMSVMGESSDAIDNYLIANGF